MHIKTILVPADFSPLGTLAINEAVALARRFTAKLVLLHVIEPSPFSYTFPADSEAADRKRIDQAGRMLEAAVPPEDQDDLDLEIIVRTGSVEEEIEAVIHETGADLVVMGTHGRRLLARLLIGSVTLHLLRKIDVPIVTVSDPVRPPAFRRILFATDFSDASNEAFRNVLELAVTMKSDVIAANVIDKRPKITYETPAVSALFDQERRRAVDRAKSGFGKIERSANTVGIRVETVLAEGIPAEAILRIADENEADCIVVGLGKKSLLERALSGTTAERLVREARIPVISIPIGSGVTAGMERTNEIHDVPDTGT